MSARAARGYYRRIALLSALLCALILVAAGLAVRRDRPFPPGGGPARPTAVAAAPAPRCSDGTDSVGVVAQSPNGPGASRDSPITVTFSCPVDRQAVERAFALYPVTPGSFTWQGETLIFRPAEPLRPQTTYRVTLFDGLSDSRGFVNGRKVSWPFVTRAAP